VVLPLTTTFSISSSRIMRLMAWKEFSNRRSPDFTASRWCCSAVFVPLVMIAPTWLRSRSTGLVDLIHQVVREVLARGVPVLEVMKYQRMRCSQDVPRHDGNVRDHGGGVMV